MTAAHCFELVSSNGHRAMSSSARGPAPPPGGAAAAAAAKANAAAAAAAEAAGMCICWACISFVPGYRHSIFGLLVSFVYVSSNTRSVRKTKEQIQVRVALHSW